MVTNEISCKKLRGKVRIGSVAEIRPGRRPGEVGGELEIASSSARVAAMGRRPFETDGECA